MYVPERVLASANRAGLREVSRRGLRRSVARLREVTLSPAESPKSPGDLAETRTFCRWIRVYGATRVTGIAQQIWSLAPPVWEPEGRDLEGPRSSFLPFRTTSGI